MTSINFLGLIKLTGVGSSYIKLVTQGPEKEGRIKEDGFTSLSF